MAWAHQVVSQAVVPTASELLPERTGRCGDLERGEYIIGMPQGNLYAKRDQLLVDRGIMAPNRRSEKLVSSGAKGEDTKSKGNTATEEQQKKKQQKKKVQEVKEQMVAATPCTPPLVARTPCTPPPKAPKRKLDDLMPMSCDIPCDVLEM